MTNEELIGLARDQDILELFPSAKRLFELLADALEAATTISELIVAKAEAWDEGAIWAAVECNAIDDETQPWIADGDNPYREATND